MVTTTSVVIATHNRGAQLRPTLDSVLNQSSSADQIIVVDDCSTDGTGDWVRSNYPQVAVVRPERNLFTSGARNLGARHAWGDWLLFLDHDDRLHPDALASIKGLRRSFPEACAVFADHAQVNEITGVVNPDHHTTEKAFHRLGTVPVLRSTPDGRLYGRAMYLALLRGNLLQQPWSIERTLFERLGGFSEDVRYCEDWDMYLRVTRAASVVLTDRVISTHYIEGTNLHLTPNQAAMHMRVIERVLHQACLRDPAAAWVLRRRLAGYLKREGDVARLRSLRMAWRCYLRSLYYWPFDHVVATRSLLWSCGMLLGRF